MSAREIRELQQQLEDLTIEFNLWSNTITRRIRRLQESVTDRTDNSDDDDSGLENDTFEIGHIVEITNNYRNNRGLQGIIERITPQRITINKIDQYGERTGTRHRCAPWNLRRV